jgi:lysine 2,3-aminomutase
MFKEESILQKVRTLGQEYIDEKRELEAQNIAKQIADENPQIVRIFQQSETSEQAKVTLKELVVSYLKNRPDALSYYKNIQSGKTIFDKLSWKDMGAIRLMDYIEHEGNTYEDLNLRGKKVTSAPIDWLWKAFKFNKIIAGPGFFTDMLYLFRQFSGLSTREIPSAKEILDWMERYPSGLDPEVVELRKKNMKRILGILIDKLDSGEIKSTKFTFKKGDTLKEKF